jgi:sec-independent protein translocase protein TatA
MPNLGPTELIIILIIVILIFGVNKIPKLGKGLGEGIRNFKSSLKEGQEEPKDDKEEKS